MIIQTKDFKTVCSTVLAATDSSELSTLTEVLELKTIENILYLNVTNKEYFAQVKFQLDHNEEFHASVNAQLFLKLVAAITSDTMELTVNDTYMNIKANGNYKLPLIFENNVMMEVPAITIQNKVVEMNVSGDILQSIVNYNSKQLLVGSVTKPVQKMFYLDQEGCITFTNGACVNKFTLEKPVKVLLSARLVNLFKLFKNEMTKFTLGYDPISETIIQTKVSFETPVITLTAITGSDDTLLNQFPANNIRARADFNYPNKVVFNTAELSEAINRLLLFSAGYGSKETLKPYSLFNFEADKVTMFDTKRENIEILKYQNGTQLSEPYSLIVDLTDFKKVVDGCTEQYLTLNFGNHQALVIARNAISNVIQEIRKL